MESDQEDINSSEEGYNNSDYIGVTEDEVQVTTNEENVENDQPETNVDSPRMLNQNSSANLSPELSNRSYYLEHLGVGLHSRTTSISEEASRFRDVFTFGQNSYGELAHGDTTERHAPNRVEFIRQHNIVVTQVVAGNEHTAILSDNGDVYTCGYNDSGQCGIGVDGRIPSLKLVEALRGKNIEQIYSANGCEHLMAVSSDGTLYTCGYNARGQLGHGSNVHSNIPKAVIFGTKRISKVSCSYYHSVISTDQGEIYAFGRNDFGQLGLGDAIDRQKPTKIVSVDGNSVLSLACGQYHTLVALDSGLFACGKNEYGQLGIGVDSEQKHVLTAVSSEFLTENSVVVQVACGYYHSIVLTSNGRVFSFGRNDYGQLGLGNKDATRTPRQLETLSHVEIIQISCGCYHTLLLSEEGYVYATGRNNHGQLGTNTAHDTTLPKQIEALKSSKISICSAGFYHSICLTGPPFERVIPKVFTLNNDLRMLLNNQACSDVTFIVENRPIFAHRCIIMARCEPLEKMLSGPMREGSETEIVLPSVQYDVFLALLEFLYTDTVECLNPESVGLEFSLDLLTIADQYLVNPLKRLCEVAIQKSISIANVSFMLRTADARQALSLRKTCFDFVLRHFGQVIATPGFVELPSEILHEVLAAASKRGVCLRPVA